MRAVRGGCWGGGGGFDWIGLVLRFFREGHPGVTGHTAHWNRDFHMRIPPLCPATQSRCPVTTHQTLPGPAGATTGLPFALCSLCPISGDLEPTP